MSTANSPLKKVTLQEGLVLAAGGLTHLGHTPEYLKTLSQQSDKVIVEQIPNIRGILKVVLAQDHGAVLQ